MLMHRWCLHPRTSMATTEGPSSVAAPLLLFLVLLLQAPSEVSAALATAELNALKSIYSNTGGGSGGSWTITWDTSKDPCGNWYTFYIVI